MKKRDGNWEKPQRKLAKQQKVVREKAPGLPGPHGGWPESPLGKPKPMAAHSPNPGMGGVHLHFHINEPKGAKMHHAGSEMIGSKPKMGKKGAKRRGRK